MRYGPRSPLSSVAVPLRWAVAVLAVFTTACGGGPAAVNDVAVAPSSQSTTAAPSSTSVLSSGNGSERALTDLEGSALETELDTTDLTVELVDRPSVDVLVVVVTNLGPNPADQVELHITPAAAAVRVSEESPICAQGQLLVCSLGPIFARQKVELVVMLNDPEATGASIIVVNLAGVDSEPSNNSLVID